MLRATGEQVEGSRLFYVPFCSVVSYLQAQCFFCSHCYVRFEKLLSLVPLQTNLQLIPVRAQNNVVLKTKFNYKCSELPEFTQSVLELVKEQQQELEQAILGRGKIRFRAAYSNLQVAERKWFCRSA